MIKNKIVTNSISVLIMASLIVATFLFGMIYAVDYAGIYAAEGEQQTSVSNFKVEGDYYYTSVDTTGKTSLGAQLPSVNHVAPISGIYTVEIITPKGNKGGKSSYDNYKGRDSGSEGSSGLTVSFDCKIAKGSKITTVGNLYEGIGLRGIIQVAGGNGGTGSNSTNNTYPQAGAGGNAFFGGRGGNGSPGSGAASGGGSGFTGGSGGSGYSGVGATAGASGGPGYLPGVGGSGGAQYAYKANGRDTYATGAYAASGAAGTKYEPPAQGVSIGQDASGTIKYTIGGAVPTFTEVANDGTIGSIKITLKKIDTTIGNNDGIVSVEVTEATSWEAMGDMAKAMNRMADAMENSSSRSGEASGSSGTDKIPTITVVAGQNFRVCIGEYDDMLDGTSNGVTVKNEVIGDGLIVLSGKIDTEGIYRIEINGKRFGINVLSEVSSSNVSAILN